MPLVKGHVSSKYVRTQFSKTGQVVVEHKHASLLLSMDQTNYV